MKKEKILISAIICISILFIFIGGTITGMIIWSPNFNKAYIFNKNNDNSELTKSSDFFVKQEVMKDLPKEIVINFRILGKDYSIRNGLINYGYSQNPDATLIIPDYYADSMFSDPCKTIQEAYKNNDVKVDINKPILSLALKYRVLLSKYGSCIK